MAPVSSEMTLSKSNLVSLFAKMRQMWDTFNPSTQEAEADRSLCAQGQSELCSETLFQ